MRALKKVFAAAVLGTVGFGVGGYASAHIWGNDLAQNLQSQCGKDWFKSVTDANDVMQKDPSNKAAVDNFKNALLHSSKDYPCSEAIVNDGLHMTELAWGLAAAGALGGAIAFGRKKKADPSPT